MCANGTCPKFARQSTPSKRFREQAPASVSEDQRNGRLRFRASTSMSRKYRPNKRRRSQAFPEDHETVVLDGDSDAKDVIPGVKNMQAEEPEPDPPDAMQVDEVSNGERPLESGEELSRRQEMWEVFQEEHHEGTLIVRGGLTQTYPSPVLDQLPLSLQRSYSLISELDDQVNSTSAILERLHVVLQPSSLQCPDSIDVEGVRCYSQVHRSHCRAKLDSSKGCDRARGYLKANSR